MRRVGGAGIALALMSVLVIAFVGQSTMISTPTARFVMLGFVFVLIAAAVWLASKARDSLPEMRWRRHAGPIEPMARPPTTSCRVAGALGRVEAKLLALNPWFAVGVVLCLFYVIITSGVFRGEGIERSWGDYFHTFPGMAHALVGMIVIAAHRAATRARREHTDELFQACPADATVRTLGFLRTAWVPGAALIVFMGATLALGARLNHGMYGRIGAQEAGYVMAALLLGAGGVALGVALAQWWRWGLAGVVAVVAVGFASLRLGSIGEPRWSSVRELATWTPFPPYAAIFTQRPVWWHAGWLLGLVALVMAIALLAHRRDRVLLWATAGAVLVSASCGVVVTRPMSAASARRIADLIAHPTRHDTCTPARADGHVQVCVYRQYPDFGEMVARDVTPVASALPAGAPPITLQQVFDGHVSALPVEVARRLPDGATRAGPALTFSHNPGARLANRVLVALAAVGLPADAIGSRRPYVAAGEARGVVALWLATRGASERDARVLTTGRQASGGNPGTGAPDAFDRGYIWPGGCGGGAPVVWSAQDLLAARRLGTLPEADVLRVVHAEWPRWTSAGTSTDELLAALGQTPVSPFDRFATRLDATC